MINLKTPKKTTGFTLIEILIVVAIVGILASIAYPSYTGSIERARREEGKRTLVEASQMMENYYAMNVNYNGTVTGTTLNIFTANADFREYYTLTASATTSSFTLTATPIGGQANDDCGTLTISQNGSTTAGGTGCW